MRVYEFSKLSGIANKDLLEHLRKHGFVVANHMALLAPDMQELLERDFLKKEENKSASPRPQEGSSKQEAKTKQHPPKQKKMEKVAIQDTQVVQPGIVIKPMTVGELADKAHRPVSEVILTLLRQGIVAAKNQVVSEKVVGGLAELYKIPVIKAAQDRQATLVEKVVAGKDSRPPVVVVIGHVDHGKTTFLDYIRQTRVAAKEKGGITQHIGSYQVSTSHGEITFLDTPGHEAFSMIRVRGLKVADIAILMIAGDDGIMPQTLEAIRAAKQANLPVIVAINKIDKATPAQIETVKRSLSQHDLVPEEWGGQTICMPISAKMGTGIKELLDMIALQAQLMELTTDRSLTARGFIIESRLEKGRGAVATVICQQGTLSVGDYFVCGSTRGRVSSLVDYLGKRIQQAFPAQPVSVAGFDEIPQVGEGFEVVSLEEYKAFKPRPIQEDSRVRQVITENSLPLIIKTDTLSSKEALLQAIKKMSGKAFKEFYIVSTHVGAVTESDVMLAADTSSMIYALHVKVEPNALLLAQKLGVTIKLFDIIYKMLEDLEVVAEQGRPVKKVLKKIGEAVVLKVFDIKSLGVIAGAQVKSGRFTRDGKVVVWRGKFKVGEGSIKSLQRDKKTVKEVHTGFECAFMVDGFDEWQVDDRVECMAEVEATA